MAALAMLVVSASSANAGQTHLYLEDFPPSFGYAKAAAVDQSTGDILVVDAEAREISRWHSDGTPSNFSALGTNTIDGEGAGPPCAPPSIECDGTPQNGLEFASDPRLVQIAVDNSDTATDGNIYVTQNTSGGGTVNAIYIFASSGEYLGQLTAAGTTSFSGGGAGSPCGVAVDPAGNVYVSGLEADEIYKFDPSSNPPTNVDHTATFSSPRPCSLAAGDGPSAGSIFVNQDLESDVFKLDDSSGATEYLVHRSPNTNEYPQHVSVNPTNGHVFVTTGGAAFHVYEYDASGNSGPTLIWSLAEGSNGVAVDGSSGRLYLVRAGFLKVYGPLVPLPDVTTGSASNIGKTSATLNGTVDANGEELTECFFEYGITTAYGATAPCGESFAEIGTGTAEVHADISGLDEEAVYHFRLLAANANGPADPQGQDESFQTRSKPEILASWSEEVTLREATLKAQVNPQSAATTCRFEWGTSSSYGNSGAVISIGSEPQARAVNLLVQGLEPGVAYHYRVVCENEMGTSAGPDRTFITFPPSPPAETDCPNQPFRTRDSALLPDCRAYEMVSPVDKNGGDIASALAGNATPPDAGGYVQAAPDGERITYTAVYSSFADQKSSFKFSQYLGSRGARGWASEGIHPPVVGSPIGGVFPFGFYRSFMAFTPDLCSAWLLDIQTPPATPDGHVGYPNLYRRDNCESGAGGLEALTPSPEVELPPGTGPGYVGRDSVQGVSDDARHAIFTAEAQLTSDARPEGPGPDTQIYDRFGGKLSLVSVLPGGVADPTEARVGNGINFNLENAVSTDGSRVYWTSGGAGTAGMGRLYLRLHPEQGIVSGECTEADIACTLPVSASSEAFFWRASPDGAKALYDEEGLVPGAGRSLYEYDLEKAEAGEPSRRLVATHVSGVLGASENLSRIYFVSRDAIPGAGENSEGEEAQPGEPNIYLEEGGGFTFVGTLVDADIEGFEPKSNKVRAYSPISVFPILRATRVTPDGTRIVFESRASMTGYDNRAVDSGRPAVEVFTYEAGGALECISCNPSQARPSGTRELRMPYRPPFEVNYLTDVPAAAWIPTWEHPLHASNVLSADGDRLFFNSNDALLPRDSNGAQDVYEWETLGRGSCDEEDADYFPQNGGCLYLISSGKSSYESEFWEASTDGDDVFFTTGSSLLPQDPGSLDLYDARVGGGFPQPEPRADCEGEACQSPPPPPNDSTPASGSYRGPGDLPRLRNCRALAKRAALLSRRAKGLRKAARHAESAVPARTAQRRARQLAKRAKKLGKQARTCRRANRRVGR